MCAAAEKANSFNPKSCLFLRTLRAMRVPHPQLLIEGRHIIHRTVPRENCLSSLVQNWVAAMLVAAEVRGVLHVLWCSQLSLCQSLYSF